MADNLQPSFVARVRTRAKSQFEFSKLKTLTSIRLCLGPVTTADYPAIASLNADPAVQRFLCLSKAPPTHEEALANLPCFLSTPAPNGGGLWCIRNRSTTDFLGLIMLLYTENRAKIELGYRLRPTAWGYGYATEAGLSVVNHAFGDLGLTELCAVIHPDNTASITVAEKLGFLRMDYITRFGFKLGYYTLIRDSLISCEIRKTTTD